MQVLSNGKGKGGVEGRARGVCSIRVGRGQCLQLFLIIYGASDDCPSFF